MCDVLVCECGRVSMCVGEGVCVYMWDVGVCLVSDCVSMGGGVVCE